QPGRAGPGTPHPNPSPHGWGRGWGGGDAGVVDYYQLARKRRASPFSGSNSVRLKGPTVSGPWLCRPWKDRGRRVDRPGLAPGGKRARRLISGRKWTDWSVLE